VSFIINGTCLFLVSSFLCTIHSCSMYVVGSVCKLYGIETTEKVVFITHKEIREIGSLQLHRSN